jgi:hypothetical protein
MITKTTKYIRPSADVTFPPNSDPALQSYINATYRSHPAKLVSKTQTISGDTLSLTIVQVFADEAAMNEFDNDPRRAEYIAMRDAHINANGLVVETVIS